MLLEVWGFEPGGLISPASKEGRMLEMLSIPPMRLNRNKHLSELVWLAILLFPVTLMCQEGNGSLGMMIMGQFKQTRSEVQKLIKSKEAAFQERETEQTHKRTMPLTSKRVISDSLLSSSSGLPSQVRSVLGSDPLSVENRLFNT